MYIWGWKSRESNPSAARLDSFICAAGSLHCSMGNYGCFIKHPLSTGKPTVDLSFHIFHIQVQ